MYHAIENDTLYSSYLEQKNNKHSIASFELFPLYLKKV